MYSPCRLETFRLKSKNRVYATDSELSEDEESDSIRFHLPVARYGHSPQSPPSILNLQECLNFGLVSSAFLEYFYEYRGPGPHLQDRLAFTHRFH